MIGIILVSIGTFFEEISASIGKFKINKKEGSGFALFTAINAVFTISLYKYDISHFNSVEAEQSIITIILMLYFFFTAIYIGKENPLRLLIKPIFFTQSMAQGIGCVLESFAYKFAPASIILTAKRSSAVSWTIASGSAYFHEKHIFVKIVCLILLILGLILLII